MARASLPYASVLGASDSRMRAEQMRAEREARVAALMGKGMETLAGAGSQALRAGADWQQQNAQLERQRRMDEAAAKQREFENTQSTERLGFDRMRAEREKAAAEFNQQRQKMLDQQDWVDKSVPALARGPGTPEEKRQALVVWAKNNGLDPRMTAMARAKLETEIEAVQEFGVGLKGKEAQARLTGASADVAEGTKEARIAEAGLNVEGKELDIEGKEQEIEVQAAKERDRALDAALDRAMGVAQRGGTMDEVMSVMPAGTDPAAVQAFIRDAGRTRGMEDDAFLRAKEKAKSDLRTAAVGRERTRAETDKIRWEMQQQKRAQEIAEREGGRKPLTEKEIQERLKITKPLMAGVKDINRALELAQDSSLYGWGDNLVASARSYFGVSPTSETEMREIVLTQLTQRLHDMSGAAVTDAEFARLAPTLPRLTDQNFPEAMARFRERMRESVIGEIEARRARGYDTEDFDAILAELDSGPQVVRGEVKVVGQRPAPGGGAMQASAQAPSPYDDEEL